MALIPQNMESLRYAELQQLAKQCGVKANMKVKTHSLSTPSTRRGYCFDFGCMFVCLYVSALERKRLIGIT